MERLIGFDFGNDSVPSDKDFIKVVISNFSSPIAKYNK